MEIFEDLEQGTEEWRKLRAGIPTASVFSTLLASGRGGAESKTRQTLLYKMAGERITGEPAENYTNGYMDRGHAMEDEARQHYSFVRDCEPRRVGFVRNGKCGCSPDALVGDDGMLEIKTAAPHILIPLLLKGEAPPEHRAQLQGNLMVAEREWIDLIVYYSKMKPLIIRHKRDEAYISDLRKAVDDFDRELCMLVEKLKAA
jgi:hypothetical protein